MSITYTAGWSVLMRGMLYQTFRHPHCLWLLPIMLLPTPFLVWLDQPIVIIFGVTGAWAGFVAVNLLFAVVGGVVTQTGKSCTTTISEDGLRDESWPRQTIIDWSRVIKIICTETDIFILRKGIGAGTFLPIGAFNNSREAQLFFETAVHYWRHAKLGQVAVLPHDETVWPPAPKV